MIDLARTESAEQLTVALDSGLRDGKFNKSLVHRRIVALRPRGRFGVPRLIDAIEGSDAIRNAHSWLECEYLRLVAVAGLALPLTQQVVTSAGGHLVRVDSRFPASPQLGPSDPSISNAIPMLDGIEK